MLYISISHSPQKIIISFISALLCNQNFTRGTITTSTRFTAWMTNGTLFCSNLFLKSPSTKTLLLWHLSVFVNSYPQTHSELPKFRETVRYFCCIHPFKSLAPSHLNHACVRWRKYSLYLSLSIYRKTTYMDMFIITSLCKTIFVKISRLNFL